MKLAILGGGGVRIPALVRAIAGDPATVFDRIDLFEPALDRRVSIGRLSVELASALGKPGTVSVTDDVEAALTDADYVFSAIRVGGDRGRVIDERIALDRGLVGQETTGPGGCAMALRTIPAMLRYCEILSRVAPRAVVVNFTNPVGIISEAITAHSDIRVVGVCDTPFETLGRIGEYLRAEPGQLTYSYGGLNHLGWISSVMLDGQELIDELLEDFEKLRAFDPCFAAFDPGLVRRVGSIPTEYLYYFYDPARYVAGVGRAGSTRGELVHRFNEVLVGQVMQAFDKGSVSDAWSAYSRVMRVRSESYMRLDVDGQATELEETSGHEPEKVGPASGEIGGYEGVALRVIRGLSGGEASRIVLNIRNGHCLDFLDPDDVVEVPALVDKSGVTPLVGAGLSPAARGLTLQVKEYERGVVEAAVTGDARLAAVALSLHPLVPGLTVAKDLMTAYQEGHGSHLAYLR